MFLLKFSQIYYLKYYEIFTSILYLIFCLTFFTFYISFASAVLTFFASNVLTFLESNFLIIFISNLLIFYSSNYLKKLSFCLHISSVQLLSLVQLGAGCQCKIVKIVRNAIILDHLGACSWHYWKFGVIRANTMILYPF